MATIHTYIKLMTYSKRVFACDGLSAWNSLLDWLKDTSLSFDVFKTSLKTFLFCNMALQSTTEIIYDIGLKQINIYITFTLHYITIHIIYIISKTNISATDM